jgi:hypothetical protein
MTNNSEEQQTSTSWETIRKETIIEVVIQPPTPEAKVESDAPPAVITTQPAQPMPEHDDSIAVVMWEATVTGRRLIDEMVTWDHSTWHSKRKQKGTISTSTSCRMASYR